jgi:glutaredoxin
MDNLTLYSTDGCPFFIKTKSFLKEKHIVFTQIMIRFAAKE